MSQKIVDAITAEWNSISVDQQKQLIFQYLSHSGGHYCGNWMEFLENQFGLEDGAKCALTEAVYST